MTDISIFIWFGAIIMFGLFLSLLILTIYVLRTSYSERKQLVDVLAQYASSLQDMAIRLQELAEIISDVEKRIERLEFSRGGGLSVSGGSNVNVGRDAIAGDSTR